MGTGHATEVAGEKAASQKWQSAVLPLVAAIGIVAVEARTSEPLIAEGEVQGDAAQYLAASRGHKVDAPFCYRVGVPAVVRFLGGTESRFAALNLVALTTTLALLWFALGRTSFNSRVLAFAWFLSTQGWALQFRNPLLIDPFALLLTVMLFVLRRGERWSWYLLVLAVAVSVRETFVCAALQWWPAKKRMVGSVLTGATALAFIVHEVGLMSSDQTHGVSSKGFLAHVGDSLAALGAGWLAVVLYLRRRSMGTPSLDASLFAGLAIAVATSVVAVNTTRMYLLASPLVALVMVRVTKPPLWATVAAAATSCLCFVTWFPNHVAPENSRSIQAGLALVMLFLVWISRSPRQPVLDGAAKPQVVV